MNKFDILGRKIIQMSERKYKINRICLICNKRFLIKHPHQIYCNKKCFKIANILITKIFEMIQRTKNLKRYSHVKIYKKWIDNKKMFLIWCLNNGWKPNLQIDRIDGKKGYYPENCRFITNLENSRNKIKHSTDWKNKIRICAKCKIKKDFSLFPNNKCKIDGIGYHCRICSRIINKNSYHKNKVLLK